MGASRSSWPPSASCKRGHGDDGPRDGSPVVDGIGPRGDVVFHVGEAITRRPAELAAGEHGERESRDFTGVHGRRDSAMDRGNPKRGNSRAHEDRAGGGEGDQREDEPAGAIRRMKRAWHRPFVFFAMFGKTTGRSESSMPTPYWVAGCEGATRRSAACCGGASSRAGGGGSADCQKSRLSFRHGCCMILLRRCKPPECDLGVVEDDG